MAHGRAFTKREIYKYIASLECEIDLCLACDLPINHIEKEIDMLNKMLLTKKIFDIYSYRTENVRELF